MGIVDRASTDLRIHSGVRLFQTGRTLRTSVSQPRITLPLGTGGSGAPVALRYQSVIGPTSRGRGIYKCPESKRPDPLGSGLSQEPRTSANGYLPFGCVAMIMPAILL